MQDVLAEDWNAECGFKAKWSSTGKETDPTHRIFARIDTVSRQSWHFEGFQL